MRFRTLDADWDWQIGRGKNDYASDSLAVSFDLKTKILSWLNDCFFSMDSGLNWQKFLGGKVQKNEIDSAIKNQIVFTQEVAELVYFDSSVMNRKYTCTARVKTIYGDTIEVKI